MLLGTHTSCSRHGECNQEYCRAIILASNVNELMLHSLPLTSCTSCTSHLSTSRIICSNIENISMLQSRNLFGGKSKYFLSKSKYFLAKSKYISILQKPKYWSRQCWGLSGCSPARARGARTPPRPTWAPTCLASAAAAGASTPPGRHVGDVQLSLVRRIQYWGKKECSKWWLLQTSVHDNVFRYFKVWKHYI